MPTSSTTSPLTAWDFLAVPLTCSCSILTTADQSFDRVQGTERHWYHTSVIWMCKTTQLLVFMHETSFSLSQFRLRPLGSRYSALRSVYLVETGASILRKSWCKYQELAKHIRWFLTAQLISGDSFWTGFLNFEVALDVMCIRRQARSRILCKQTNFWRAALRQR